MHEKTHETLERLVWLAALVAFLPFLTIHVSFLLAANAGHVPWCFPYLDSCTSISATGRHAPEKYWFKGMMIPAALLTAWFWRELRHWLSGYRPGEARRTPQVMQVLGLLAALFLILYTLALGEAGDNFRRVRRIGVTLSFTFTYLAQLLCTRALHVLARAAGDARLARWHRRLLGLLLLLLATGLLSVLLDAWMGSAYDAVEDAFEWVLALQLNLYFALLACLLREQRNVRVQAACLPINSRSLSRVRGREK